MSSIDLHQHVQNRQLFRGRGNKALAFVSIVVSYDKYIKLHFQKFLIAFFIF
jgi:hypothetical protein